MKKINWLLVIAVLSISPISQARTLYEEIIYNKPDPGVENEVYLGDRMLVQQVGEWKECITPHKSYNKVIMGTTGIYKAGQPICKTNLSDKFYSPTYANKFHAGKSFWIDVEWGKKKGKYSLCQREGSFIKLTAFCMKNLTEDDVKKGETFIYAENSLQQTIDYAGRSGDVLKFNYSEFSDNFARQAFTREFQIDLNEGKIAAYKGAIIEVIEATNIQIKYKVIRNFSSDR
jgi:hypothetical protein